MTPYEPKRKSTIVGLSVFCKDRERLTVAPIWSVTMRLTAQNLYVPPRNKQSGHKHARDSAFDYEEIVSLEHQILVPPE